MAPRFQSRKTDLESQQEKRKLGQNIWGARRIHVVIVLYRTYCNLNKVKRKHEYVTYE